MLKYVFALVVLLHLCGGVKPNISLNKEITEKLKELEELYRVNKLNFTSDTVRSPTQDMSRKASSCVGVFARELNSLLHNVTVHEDSQHILRELMENLEALKPYQENDKMCQMRANRKSLTPFRLYTKFIRNLSAKKR